MARFAYGDSQQCVTFCLIIATLGWSDMPPSQSRFGHSCPLPQLLFLAQASNPFFSLVFGVLGWQIMYFWISCGVCVCSF